MPRSAALVAVLILLLAPAGQAGQSTALATLKTTAEASDFASTSKYAEVVAFMKAVDAASPIVFYQSYGRSYEGREMPLAVVGTGLRDLTALRRGRVSLAVTPTLGEIVLPAALRAFARQHPEIHVAVDDCAPDQFVARIVSGHVDFGIGSPEQSAGDVDTRTLRRDHLAVVVARGHPLAGQRRLRWAQLAGHAVITVRPGYGIRPLIDATASRAGVSLNVVNEVAFLATALWMADCGLGAAIMPSAYTARGAHPGRVVLPLSAPRVSRDVALVTLRGRSLSPAAQRLAQVLEGALKN